MEIGKALRYITEDARWQQKLMIGTGIIIGSFLLSFVLIGFLGFFIVAGYTVRLLQNVRDGQPYPLPEWDQLGDDLARGFKLFVVTLVWTVPVILFSIPSGIGNALIGSRSEAAQVIGVMLSIFGSCLSVIFGLALTVLLPGITIAFARDEQIRSGLQFREIWDWTVANIGQVIVVVLVYIAASLVIGLGSMVVGLLLCVIGILVTLPLGVLVTYLFQYHLYGQLASAYPMGNGGVGVMTPQAPYTPYVPPVPPVAPVDTPPAPMDTPPAPMDEPPAAPVDVPPAPEEPRMEPSSDTPPGYPDSDVDNPPAKS